MKRLVLVVLFLVLIPANLLALDLAMALNLTSGGPGAEFYTSVTDNLNARLGVYFGSTGTLERSDFEDGYDEEEEDFTYEAEANLTNVSLLFDYYLGDTSFFVSGGAFFNFSEFDVTLIPTQEVSVGIGNGATFTPEELGTANVTASPNTVCPYIGIGYGNPILFEGFNFKFDMGVIYTGEPSVEMDVNGMISEKTEDEASQIEDNISDLSFFPHISLAVTYKF